MGIHGYPHDEKEAVERNEKRITKNDFRDIVRKIDGLNNCMYGYPMNPEEVFRLNEVLVAQNNSDAIARKIEGLVYGTRLYAKNHKFFEEFMDTLNIEMRLKRYLFIHYDVDIGYFSKGNTKCRGANKGDRILLDRKSTLLNSSN